MKFYKYLQDNYLRIYLTVFLSLMAIAAYAGVKAAENGYYICMTSSSYAYHKSKNCRGLNRCSSKIEAVSLDEAVKKYGRKPCKICM